MAEGAYRAIEEMIVTRQLPPGTMVSENQLSEQLGCGRTPIREALQRLRFQGYVDIHPRRGGHDPGDTPPGKRRDRTYRMGQELQQGVNIHRIP